MEFGAGTRERILDSLLRDGPATASTLGDRLGLTPAAVRRHLDGLAEDGLVEGRDRPPYGPGAHRGRGRPARYFALTDAGRRRFPEAYDDLAAAALRTLAEVGGREAVAAFADQRAGEMSRRYAGALAEVAPAERPARLADLLTADGFAAATDAGPLGGQICQHHCPVAHVAAEFPELCDAETRIFADLLGTHVQRLATIAHGDHLCTTNVPHHAGPQQSAPDHTAAAVSDRKAAG